MRDHPDHHDAELLLRLYDLRREETLRRAREWLTGEFQADSFEDYQRRCPRGSQENTFFRMVVSYWDMAASIVNHGLIKEEFFFENSTEIWVVWQKIKPLAPGMRNVYENPFLWQNLETVAEKIEKWMVKRAPKSVEALRTRLSKPPLKN
jgi:hypothetical protein